MITALHIKNFKSLTDMHLGLTPMTVIVGNNAAGKSSILQAVDFLCSSVKEDFNIWMERRNVTVGDIRSNLVKSPYMQFSCEMELKDSDDNLHRYVWNIRLNTKKEKNDITVQTESLTCDGRELFYFSDSPHSGKAESKSGTDIFISAGIEIRCSYMRFLSSKSEDWKLIRPVKSFFENSNSYELLSPSDMRLSSRGEGNKIGMSGRNLPSFIGKMTPKQKKSYLQKLHDFLGDSIEDVTAETSRKAGWTKIKTVEKYGDKSMVVSSSDISDGILRLLAFLAISEVQAPECIMLLDEIENGINVNYSEKIIQLFRSMAYEQHHQMILTTHSTSFLDYVPIDNIVYLYRDEKGNSCAHAFASDSIRKMAQDLYPGEIILNLSPAEIIQKLLEK